MDTFKEQQQLDDMYSQGKAPWEVWKFSDMETKPLKPYSKYDEQVLNSDHHSE